MEIKINGKLENIDRSINLSELILQKQLHLDKIVIEHNSEIRDHCHISTGAIINGGVIVGERSFIGSSAVTKQYSNIPSGTFIKANSIYS